MANSDPARKRIDKSIDAIANRARALGLTDAKVFLSSSNKALQQNPLAGEADAKDFYKNVDNSVENILHVGKAISKIKRAEKIVEKMIPRSTAPSTAGHGALSSSKVWSVLGWMQTPHGFVWNRPPNMKLKEHFPPTGLTRYIADYSQVSAGLVDDSNFFPPVTSGMASSMRKEDAERNRLHAKWHREYLDEQKKKEAEKKARERFDNAKISARESAFFRLDDYRIEDEAENAAFLRKKRKEEADEQRLRESRRSIAVRRMQIDTYKKFPWVKTLVDAGIIQKKELPKIAKSLSRIHKMPLIGSLLRNPGVGLAGLIAGLTHLIGSSARAAGQVLPWQNLEIAGGTVSDYYKSLMASVGLGEKEAITSATKRKILIAGWNRAQGLEAFTKGAYYGIMPTAGMFSMTHDQLLDYVSRQAYGISDDGMRLNALAAYGINEAEYSASIQKQGLQKKTTANYVSQAAQRAKDRKAKVIADGGWWANITHPDWAIDFISSSMANDPLHGERWKRMLDEEQKAQRAAESAEEYERNKGSAHQPSNGEATSAGDQVSFNINSVNVDANNYEEFIQSVVSEAGMRYNIDVMKWADSRRVKV